MKTRIRPSGLLLALLLLEHPASAQSNRDHLKGGPEEKKVCTANLYRIGDAIHAYRRAFKTMPNKLSDLTPRFLANRKDLECPACRLSGTTSNGILPNAEEGDPGTTYAYEFSADPIPGNIGGGSTHSMRAWKQLQMGLVGSGVPMVRCHCHSLTLNLPFEGEIYPSGNEWEDVFSDYVKGADLAHPILFAKFGVEKILILPERSLDTPVHLIDLTKHYNASLREGWHDADKKNNLAALPTGVACLDKVPFDIRGVVQLRASEERPFLRTFPPAASNIVVNLPCVALHFLHATAFDVNPGTHIGSYVMRLSDGTEEVHKISYGIDVLDWWSDPAKPGAMLGDNHSTVAWSGTNPRRAKDNKTVQLYHTIWKNSKPGATVIAVDFVSEQDHSGPFLVALTAELPDEAKE